MAGIPVLILGESGSGKSTSLRNFKKGEVGVFNVAGKRLPFKSDIDTINLLQKKNANGQTINPYEYIFKTLQKVRSKSIVIDDSQYLMTFELFGRTSERGYDKFSEIGLHFYSLIKIVLDKLDDDRIVYLLHHIDKDDTGKIKAKTVGKMLDNQLCLEGLFSIVLLCKTDGTRHWFETQSDGFSTAKSPMGMFPKEIDNDLKLVDKTIRDYWNIPVIQTASTQPVQQQQQQKTA